VKACPRCGLLNPEEHDFCSGCGYRLADVTPQAPPYYAYRAGVGAHPRYAGFWIRFAAAFIDSLVLSVMVLPLNLVFRAVGENVNFLGIGGEVNLGLLFLFYLAQTLVTWAYYTYLTGRYGATLGKKLVGIKVVGEDMQPLSYATAALREIPGKLLSSMVFMLGYAWAGFDGRKQAWHDKLARTLVVYG